MTPAASAAGRTGRTSPFSYFFADRADDEPAVAALRARKQREDEPFALMVADVAAARALVVLDAAAEMLLRSVARPIAGCACSRPSGSRPNDGAISYGQAAIGAACG